MLGIFALFLTTLVSELVHERTLVSMMMDLWMLPFLVALYALSSRSDSWLFFVSMSSPFYESALIAWQGLITGLVSNPHVSRLSRYASTEHPVLSRTRPIHVCPSREPKIRRELKQAHDRSDGAPETLVL